MRFLNLFLVSGYKKRPTKSWFLFDEFSRTKYSVIKIFFITTVTLVFQFACVNKKKSGEVFDSKLPTVVAAKGYKVPNDQIQAPIVVPVKSVVAIPMGKPEVVQLESNIYPAIKKTILPVGKARKITPGEEGFKLPVKIAATDSPFLAGPPEVVQLKDFYAKDDNPGSFSTISRYHGFMSNDLNALCMDESGNLWISGWDDAGLNKYDGRTLSIYSRAQGLSSNDIYCQYADKKGNIWTGGPKGLNRFDGKTLSVYTKKNGLSDNLIHHIFQDSQGVLWISTESGLNSFDGNYFTHYTKEEGLPDGPVNRVVEDKKGNLWFGIWRSEKRYYTLMYDRKDFYDYTPVFGSDVGYMANALQDKDGSLWFGLSGSLFNFDGDSITSYSISGKGKIDFITSIIKDIPGNLWIGTTNGLYKFDGQNFTHFSVEHGLGDKHVRSVIEDMRGNIWLTTNTGLSKFDGKLFSHIQSFQGFGKSGLNSIKSDRSKNLWVTTWGAGINRYDGKSISRFTTKQGLASDQTVTVLAARSGDIWIATGRGLNRYDGKFISKYTVEDGLIHNFGYCLMEDRKGNIWIGSPAGVSKFDGKFFTNYTVAQGLSGNYINNIYEDIHGNIWFGTRDHGATCFDGTVFTHYGIDNGLSDMTVNSITEDHLKNIWFATNKGVNKFDGKEFTWYNKEQGLSADNVNNVFTSKNGVVWIGTAKGLNRYVPRSEFLDSVHNPHPLFKKYTNDEGFLGTGTYWNSITEVDPGGIWMVTVGRITNYHAEGDIPDTVAPHIQLTGIKLFNEKISWYELRKKPDSSLLLNNGIVVKNFSFSNLSAYHNVPENLELNYNNNYVSFQFVGITTNRPKEVKYSYFLEGLDDKWSAPSEQWEAVYNNLPHGKFTFKVKACNSEGYWNQELIYPFRIFPPWWKTWWFRSLAVFLIFSSFYLAIRFWTHQKYKQQIRQSEKDKRFAELQQQKTEIEMQALRAQMNPHFIFNSLNSINRFILQNDKAQASEYLTKFSRLVRLILQNSQSSMISLESELDSLRLYLDLEAVRFEHRFAYTITVPKDMDVEMLKVPPLIIQPYTENAIWHGLMHKEENGQLDIDVAEENDHLVIRVSDNGIGREAARAISGKSATKHKSFGMKITANRIAMLEKSMEGVSPVTINDLTHPDGSPAGTEVVIRIPVVNNS